MRFPSISLSLLCFFLGFSLPLSSEDKENVPFKVETFPYIEMLLSNQKNDLNLTELPGNIYEIQTTGNDPYISFKSLKDSYQPDLSYVIAFEYKLPRTLGISFFTAELARKPNQSEQTYNHRRVEVVCFSLSDSGQLIGKKIDALRMDLGELANKTFRIKNLRLIETKGN